MHRLARPLAAAGLAGVSVGLGGPSASAHITVDPGVAAGGGYTTLAFSVPTERPDMSTTKVEIRFPADHLLAGVTTEPKPGWDVTIERVRAATPSPEPAGEAGSDEAVDRVGGVTWIASSSDAAVRPGRFEVFRISVGPLPSDVDALMFDALQTYSDGEVVRWNGSPAPGSGEMVATPAPVLTLTSAPDEATRTPAPQAATAAPARSPDAIAEVVPTAEPTLDAERVSAAVDDNDRAAKVAYGLGAGVALILGTVGLTAATRRRGVRMPPT